MLKRIQRASLVMAAMSVHAAHAEGLDLTTKTNTFVTIVDALGLPFLILAIFVGVFGYWFKAVGIGFAAAIIIGGVIFGAAPEIAAFLLT